MNDAATPPALVATTKSERIDFLKQIVAFSESNVRSYDTKAQISLAAFVLSASPVVTISGVSCAPQATKMVLMVLVASYFATILIYLWVLWPVAPPQAQFTSGGKTQDIFFIRDPVALGVTAFAGKLANLDLEAELTAEALKLAHIRRVKARQFKSALVATVAAYTLIAFVYFIVGRCF